MSNRLLTPAELAEQARRELGAVVGLKVETVTKIIRASDGRWQVDADLLERKSIPDSNDLLASFTALFDAEGLLLEYRRIARYRRGDGDAQPE